MRESIISSHEVISIVIVSMLNCRFLYLNHSFLNSLSVFLIVNVIGKIDEFFSVFDKHTSDEDTLCCSRVVIDNGLEGFTIDC